MTDTASEGPAHLAHGALGYLQIPVLDPARAARFYRAVFGWTVEDEFASFTAPGLIGNFDTDVAVSPNGGPVLWFHVDDLEITLPSVLEHGGEVRRQPFDDGPQRTLAVLGDCEGNEIGLVRFGPAS